MPDLISQDLLQQAVFPALMAFATLVVSVFSGFLFLSNRNRKEINRVDARNVELTAENEKFREDLRVKEDTLHVMRRELDDLRIQRDDLVRRLDSLANQFTELSARANKLEDRMTETQSLLESERKYSQGRIDAENMARQKAELKATQLESEVKVLRTEKDALAQRLEDQTAVYKAEITALREQSQRLETESRLLSASIDDRIRSATGPLVAQIETLKNERKELELRVKELESKGMDPDA